MDFVFRLSCVTGTEVTRLEALRPLGARPAAGRALFSQGRSSAIWLAAATTEPHRPASLRRGVDQGTGAWSVVAIGPPARAPESREAGRGAGSRPIPETRTAPFRGRRENKL